MGDDTPSVVARGVDGVSGHDHVTALFSFDDQRMASLTASRITQNQIRQLEVITADRFFTVDYPNQDLVIHRRGRVEGYAGNEAEVRYSLDVDIRQVFVRRREPLIEELEHFVGSVRGDHPCEVDGRQALRALELVWEVQDGLRSGAPS
jgi:predicted dehydrogenase